MLAALALIAITHVTVIDTTGGPPRRVVTVVVRDGRIEAVAPDAVVPAGVQVVDGRGKFLIPGLWDMHVHLSLTRAGALPLLVAHGDHASPARASPECRGRAAAPPSP